MTSSGRMPSSDAVASIEHASDPSGVLPGAEHAADHHRDARVGHADSFVEHPPRNQASIAAVAESREELVTRRLSAASFKGPFAKLRPVDWLRVRLRRSVANAY